jgi:hypothetical protein
MYLARTFPLIKPASLPILSGNEPFDASAPPKRLQKLASVDPYDSGITSVCRICGLNRCGRRQQTIDILIKSRD